MNLHVTDLMEQFKSSIKNNSNTFNPIFSRHLFNSSNSVPETLVFSEFNTKPHYEVHDFNKFHGVEFINAAYLGILNRLPDQGGLDNYLGLLNKRTLTKTDILGALRFSNEGKQKKVKILGIKKRLFFLKLCRIPVLGGVFKIIAFVVNSEQTIERITRLEIENTELKTKTNQLVSSLKDNTDILSLNTIFETLITESENNFRRLNENLFRQGLQLKAQLTSQLETINDNTALNDVYKTVLKAESKVTEKINNLQALLKTKTEKKHLKFLEAKFNAAVEEKADIQDINILKASMKTKIEYKHISSLDRKLNTLFDNKADSQELNQLKSDMLKSLDSKTEHKFISDLNSKTNIKIKKINTSNKTNFKKLNKEYQKRNLKLNKAIKKKLNNSRINKELKSLHKNISDNVNQNQLMEIRNELAGYIESKVEGTELLEINKNISQLLASKVERDELLQFKRVFFGQVENKALRTELIKLRQLVEEQLQPSKKPQVHLKQLYDE